jgi:hypothetical protein
MPKTRNYLLHYLHFLPRNTICDGQMLIETNTVSDRSSFFKNSIAVYYNSNKETKHFAAAEHISIYWYLFIVHLSYFYSSALKDYAFCALPVQN